MSPSDLAAAVADILNRDPHRISAGQKKLTLALGGVYFASTTHSAKPYLVWETEDPHPRYYIPVKALIPEIKDGLDVIESTHGDRKLSNGEAPPGASGHGAEIEAIERVKSTNGKSQAVIERLSIGSKSMTWARFLEGPLKGFIRFDDRELDAWFEDGALFTHLKNPYKRIDTAGVSQHVVVKVDGVKVAETNVAVRLYETGAKEAWYIPATSVLDWSMVEKSDRRTTCPYKGEASYLSLAVGGRKYENLIWYYPYPIHECSAIAGLISFYVKDGVELIVDDVESTA